MTLCSFYKHVSVQSLKQLVEIFFIAISGLQDRRIYCVQGARGYSSQCLGRRSS